MFWGESRLSAKSHGSEQSDEDGRSPSPALHREPSLMSEIKSSGVFAKKAHAKMFIGHKKWCFFVNFLVVKWHNSEKE